MIILEASVTSVPENEKYLNPALREPVMEHTALILRAVLNSAPLVKCRYCIITFSLTSLHIPLATGLLGQ